MTKLVSYCISFLYHTAYIPIGGVCSECGKKMPADSFDGVAVLNNSVLPRDPSS